VNDPDTTPTQRLRRPLSSGTYSITRRSPDDATKIAITSAGDDLAIAVDGQHLSLSRAAAKRLVVALLEVID
jgi:hypothetical protein